MRLIVDRRIPTDSEIRYINSVLEYFEKNIYKIVYGIRELKDLDRIDEEDLKKIFGNSFPKNPKINESNYKKQVESLLKVLKIKIDFKKGKNHLKKQFEDYSIAVKNHISFTGKNIMARVSDSVEMFNGRLTYFIISNMLGDHYPKISFAIEADKRISMIYFMYEIGLIFKFDREYVYFL